MVKRIEKQRVKYASKRVLNPERLKAKSRV